MEKLSLQVLDLRNGNDRVVLNIDDIHLPPGQGQKIYMSTDVQVRIYRPKTTPGRTDGPSPATGLRNVPTAESIAVDPIDMVTAELLRRGWTRAFTEFYEGFYKGDRWISADQLDAFAHRGTVEQAVQFLEDASSIEAHPAAVAAAAWCTAMAAKHAEQFAPELFLDPAESCSDDATPAETTEPDPTE